MKPNYMRAAFFECPDYIPLVFNINDACWHHYPQDALLDLMEEHKLLFPNFERPKTPFVPGYHPVARKDAPFTDDFGCVWTTTDDGIVGTVTKHPLADWSSLESYVPPNPELCMGIGPIDWAKEAKHIAKAKAESGFVLALLRHGHTFLQLCDIRGYENLIMDMADDEPKLWTLIEIVENFNKYIVERYTDMGVDIIYYGEDLGMQFGPMLSPALLRKYIKPSYIRLMKIAQDKGVAVHMHSDGDIRTLADDLTDSGVQVLNLQDLVNGIDWIAEKYRGRLCIDLDIDRQRITPFGTPAQIDAHIKESVEKISTPQGGLMLMYGLYPGVPLENVKAVMDAMEKYSMYYN